MRPLLVSVALAALVCGFSLGAPLASQGIGASDGAFAQAGYSGRLAVGRSDGLWLVPLDGTTPTLLAPVSDNGAFITGVTWSPSGDEVAYTRFSFGEGSTVGGADLHVVGLDGADRILVSRDDPNTVLGTPAWSADGASLLFDVTQVTVGGVGSATRRIDRVAVDGTWRVAELYNAYQPNLSQDGTTLAFLRQETGGISIWARDLASGAESQVLEAGIVSGIGVPSLSPDAATIVFGASGGPGLAPDPLRCGNRPVASSWLTVPSAAAHGLPEELWRVSRDGSGLTRITSLCLDDPIVSWSPDGAWMAEYGSTNLLLLNALGGAPITIWTDGGYGGVDWTS